MNQRPILLVLASIATALGLSLKACSVGAPDLNAPIDGGADAPLDGAKSRDAHVDATSDASPEDSGLDDAPQAALPDPRSMPCSSPLLSDMPGYVPLREWYCDCGLYVPTDKSALPPPIEWEPCPAVAPKGLACSQMRRSWAKQASGFVQDVSLDPASGRLVVSFIRDRLGKHADRAMNIIAELDGPVRFAMLQAESLAEGCIVAHDSTNDGRVLFHVTGMDEKQPLKFNVQGKLAASLDDLSPRLVYLYPFLPHPFGPSSGAAVSSTHVMFIGAKESQTLVTTWDFTSLSVLHDTTKDPQALQAYDFILRGKEAFFEVTGRGHMYQMSWNPVDGERPLLRWNEGPSRHGASGLATDGKDMVWVDARGNTGEGIYEFAECKIMTAPHTTDPAELAATARVLRTEVCSVYSVSKFQVGCGYAAHIARDGLRVIRISDGRSWLLPRLAEPDLWKFNLGPVRAVTCDEVILDISGVLGRIRIDSLGAAELPN